MLKRFISPKTLTVFAIVIGLILCVFLLSPQTRREDYKRISSENYDSVFLSMFPIDNYEEEDFTTYRAQNTLKTTYCIPNMHTLKSYMKKIATSGNTISTIYLGVNPEKIASDQLLTLLQQYPSVNYQIILPYASVDYWTDYSEQERTKSLAKYRELTDTLLPMNNVTVYLFAQEWLLCNPANYDDTFLTNKDISRTLMLSCDRNHPFFITPDNADTIFAEFAGILENNINTPKVYPDLSDYKIVFFGDSVIGNYTDSTSIPNVVGGLTHATVFNCGYGGNSASLFPDAPINLPGIVDAFINKDTSPLPQDTQVYAGMTEYLQDYSDTKQLCFVINYGLNDYFIGAPVSTEDPYDVTSYSGALRTAVHSLQEAYPEAQIILMAPNFTSYFSNGEERKSDVGGILTDYVEAVINVGADRNITVLNNYTELPINADNHGTYLHDGCHPNERTRFTIGSRIALEIN